MTDSGHNTSPQSRNAHAFGWPLLTAAAAIAYALLTVLSRRFAYGSPASSRPLLAVIAVLSVCFALYLAAIWLACRVQGLFWPVVGACIFRLIVLPSTPIQEVDIYRYLWDGASLAAGVSPFKHPPQQAAAARSDDPAIAASLRRLAELRESEAGIHDALDRVHYPALTTVYPPVSQAVFALAAATTPRGAGVETRVCVMKAWLVAFDLATLLLVIALLRQLGASTALCVVYGWCPLLLKEVANSGHLDAIAVAFTTFACWLQLPPSTKHSGSSVETNRPRREVAKELSLPGRNGTLRALGAAAALALGVGAKLYPVVLAPIFMAWTWKRSKRLALIQGVAFVVFASMCLAPMLLAERALVSATGAPPAASDGTANQSAPLLPAAAEPADATMAPSGLNAFLHHWEMNDFIFMLAFENLRPTAELPYERQAWFSVVPESWRNWLLDRIATALSIRPTRAAFLMTRGALLGLWLLIVMGLIWRASKPNGLVKLRPNDARMDPSDWRWLETCFLSIAWFWLLCPTLNPWYWTWTLPLLVFARSRVWMLVSGVVLVYYLRFYLDYHYSGQPVLGTRYPGVHFFDYVVTWFEHLPYLLCLALSSWLGRASIYSPYMRNCVPHDKATIGLAQDASE